MKKLFEHSAVGLQTSIRNGMYLTSCKYELFPSVYLLVESHWVEMSPKDYIVRASTDFADRNNCFIGFTSVDADTFVLGDSFMRGFYTIHSDSTSMVGIVPHSNSIKSSPQYEPVMPTRLMDATAFFNLTLVQIEELVAGLFATCMLVYLGYYCLKSIFNDEDDGGNTTSFNDTATIATLI